MKRYERYLPLIGALIVLAQLTSPVLAAKPHMYRCKDANGRVYYTDRPGVNCAGNEADEMTKHGLILEREGDKSATPGETADERQKRIAKQRSDRALLQTYSSEEQIEAAKQANLQTPLLAVKYAKKKLAIYNERLDELRAREETMMKAGQTVPLDLIENIDATVSDISQLEAELEIKQRRVDRIVERFEVEKERYRKLTAEP